MKYPKESLPKKKPNQKHIADKKFGFFQQDVDTFKEVAVELDWNQRGNPWKGCRFLPDTHLPLSGKSSGCIFVILLLNFEGME